jgi:hypothetical protein
MIRVLFPGDEGIVRAIALRRDPNESAVLIHKPTILVAYLNDMSYLRADENCHFLQVLFCGGLRTLPAQRNVLIWQREYEVAIDPAQKKPPCGACRCGCSFVFPRSGLMLHLGANLTGTNGSVLILSPNAPSGRSIHSGLNLSRASNMRLQKD